MNKKALSALPRPEVTEKQKELPFLMSNIAYSVTAERQVIDGQDTLIMNFFKCGKKDVLPVFRTFCQEDDYITQDLTTEKTKWKTAEINYLIGYMYWYHKNGNIVINSMEERSVILEFLQEFKARHGVNDYQQYNPEGTVVDMEVENFIDEYQDTIKKWKLQKKHQKEKDYIDNRMIKFGDLPEDYDSFIEESVFREENYIFYDLPAATAYCTKCKHDFLIDKKKHLIGKGIPIWNDTDIVKHNHTVRCPWCHSYLKCKSERMGRQGLFAVQWSVLIQKDGEDVLVRYLCHTKNFRESYREPKIHSTELFRTIHTAEKSDDYEWYRFKSTQEVRWCILKDRSYGYFPPSEFDVPRTVTLYNQDLKKSVAGTCMKYSAIDLYVKYVLDTRAGISKPWFVDWYFNAYRENPFIEQLLKVGFYRMTREFLDDYNAPNFIAGRSILDSLGINKIQYNMLRKVGNPGLRDLEILRYKPDLTWKQFTILRCIQDEGMDQMYRKYAYLMQYTTLHKLTRYIADQKINHKSDYFDYTEWTEEMGYDMRNEFNLFPKDFYKTHDDRSKEYIKFKDKQAREEVRRFDQFLKKMNKETADVEAMNLRIGGLFIRLPVKLEELKEEGEALHHCVGTYMEKVRKGETMIFFIRQEAEPDKAFYTLEWHGKVVQCRGFKNCDMTAEVKAFVTIFEKKMQEYASEPVKKHRKAG